MRSGISCFQDELLEQVILHYFGTIEQDHDPEVRLHVVELLLDFVKQSNNIRSMDVIIIIEKVCLTHCVKL